MELFIQKYWMVLIGLILMAISMIWEWFRVSKETGKRYDIYQNLKSRVEQGTIEVDDIYNLGVKQ